MSPLEQETACINSFRPASLPLQSLAVDHMAKVKSWKIVQYGCAILRLRNTFAQSRDCAIYLCNLEIVQTYCAISRKRIAQSQDCLHNLEIGTQFRDSENALRNLEIAQIPKLRGTCTCVYTYMYIYRRSGNFRRN